MRTWIGLLAFAGAAGAVASAAAQPLAAERVEALMIAADGRAIPLSEERLSVAIDGQHATSTMLQVYTNNSGQLEGRYRLRPGSGSRVEGFAYWNGETKIVGEVFERQTARQVYDNVTTRRRDPGLLEEDGEGAFAFKIFPINAGEKKRVEVRWSKWLERRGNTVRYRAPVTRGDAEVVVTLRGAAKNLRSPTHRLHVEATSDGARVRSDGSLRAGELILEWDADEPAWTPSVYVQPGDDGWFALSLAAPDTSNAAIAAKDVTLVIDRSGSMIGEPIEHAKAAAANMIRLLRPGDRVNVIAFSDEVDPLFAMPKVVDDATRARAISFVERMHDGGGTDIALALSTAIKSQEAGSERPRVVVFMTDGQSDVDKAFEAAKTDAGDVRLFTLGLGKDVNRPLLQRLAAQKRGRFVYIENASSIEREVSRLAASISKPLLVGVSVDVEGVQAVRTYPRSLPDLFAEDELLVTGRLRGTGTAKFTIRGKLAGKPVAFTRSVDVGKSGQRPWVGRLWAAARVDHLLEELSLGAKAPEIQNEVLELALAYNFVTPYTAFLAIPESELGAMAGTVAAARERKRKIMAANPDVSTGTQQGVMITDTTQNVPTGRTFNGTLGAAAGSETIEVQGNSPTIDPGSTSDSSVSPTSSPRYAEVQRKSHGCAGCTSSGDAGGLAAILLALVTACRGAGRRSGSAARAARRDRAPRASRDR